MNWVDSWSGRMNDGGQLKQPGYRDISEEEFQQFLNSHPHGATIQEIATVMGMTSCRVGQIINKALVKLRCACERRGISPADVPQTESTWDQLRVG